MLWIVQKIKDNADKIVGIRLNDEFYDVDMIYQYCPSDCHILIEAHQNDSEKGIIKFEFTAGDINKYKDVKLYKLEEI